ncbi:phage tail protein [Jatrophihabitans cynanchi]|uniref:Phage tail protein n=1 Tax=Jatrophihabitans cynanchi TaxID=2944128 RepID=A0ABY7K2N6_9ACTN|nr:phage tail protein [Jatrophihabitans sp. SB3-54]WAX59082.1 phage tail protein [Jatrophihabitans sp. SB3-54]
MPLPAMDISAGYAFIVKIDGVQVPEVIEVSGLKLEVDKIEFKQQTADGKFIVRQVMGRQKAGEFTVTRGLTDSKTITDWLDQVFKGQLASVRKTAEVSLMDYSGAPIKSYSFVNCWVKSVEISSLKAGSTEPATEKFTICYDEVKAA